MPLQAADRVLRQPIEASTAHQSACAVGRLASTEPRERRLNECDPAIVHL